MSDYNHFDIIQLTRKMEDAKNRVESILCSLRNANKEVYEATQEQTRLKENLAAAKTELDVRTKAIAEYFAKGD